MLSSQIFHGTFSQFKIFLNLVNLKLRFICYSGSLEFCIPHGLLYLFIADINLLLPEVISSRENLKNEDTNCFSSYFTRDVTYKIINVSSSQWCQVMYCPCVLYGLICITEWTTMWHCVITGLLWIIVDQNKLWLVVQVSGWPFPHIALSRFTPRSCNSNQGCCCLAEERNPAWKIPQCLPSPLQLGPPSV